MTKHRAASDIHDVLTASTIGCHAEDEPRDGKGISRLVISAPAGLVLPTRGRIDPGEVRRSVSPKLQMVGCVHSCVIFMASNFEFTGKFQHSARKWCSLRWCLVSWRCHSGNRCLALLCNQATKLHSKVVWNGCQGKCTWSTRLFNIGM